MTFCNENATSVFRFFVRISADVPKYVYTVVNKVTDTEKPTRCRLGFVHC